MKLWFGFDIVNEAMLKNIKNQNVVIFSYYGQKSKILDFFVILVDN